MSYFFGNFCEYVFRCASVCTSTRYGLRVCVMRGWGENRVRMYIFFMWNISCAVALLLVDKVELQCCGDFLASWMILNDITHPHFVRDGFWSMLGECLVYGVWISSKNDNFFEIFLNIFSDAPWCVHQRDMVCMPVWCVFGEKIAFEMLFLYVEYILCHHIYDCWQDGKAMLRVFLALWNVMNTNYAHSLRSW